MCHAFMRGKCHASSDTRCRKGYHIFLQKGLAKQYLTTRKAAAGEFTPSIQDRRARKSWCARLETLVNLDERKTAQECSPTRKRKKTLAKRTRLSSSPSCEIVRIEKKDINRHLGFCDDTNRVQNQGNSSSERVTQRSSNCTGSIDAYSCADLASRERIAHQWEEKRSLETKRKTQNAEDRWGPVKTRRQTHALDHPSTPDAGSSSDRTLLDLLLEASTNAWRIESDFMIEARNLILSNARGQDMQMRGAAHQCLRTLITDRSAKPPIRFIDRISWAQFHGMLTQAQAEHLQTLRHKECVHCTDQ